MKINRRTFAFLMAGALSLCAADAFGGIRPLPPGAQPYPGWAWCPRCEGRRYVPSGFLGWTSKTCPKCDGYGMVRLPPPPPPPPPPKPVIHHKKHHHHQPALHPVKKPAPPPPSHKGSRPGTPPPPPRR